MHVQTANTWGSFMREDVSPETGNKVLEDRCHHWLRASGMIQ
jgi:hypothetical protein